ncbi:MAG: helix-hairpin-helix domain-containing protein [Patescibacteria group bacterium]
MGEEENQPQPLTWAKIWQEYQLPIVFGSISLLLIVISLTFLLKSFSVSAPIEFSSDASPAGQVHQTITIDIEGAVANPGVYRLPSGSRVEEAVVAAGGLSAEADLERIAKVINRAARLSDGAKLYIPEKGDPSPPVGRSGQVPQGGQVSGVEMVSVNHASQSELEALPGVGPVTARKIMDNRPYTSLEELISKKAMSQSLFNKLKDQLTL